MDTALFGSHPQMPTFHDPSHPFLEPCQILELPAELRVLIYLSILGGHKTMSMHFSPLGLLMTHPWGPANPRDTPTDNMAILRTNHQINTECSSVFFDCTIFDIDVGGPRLHSSEGVHNQPCYSDPILFSEHCARDLTFLLEQMRHAILTIDRSAKGRVLQHLKDILATRPKRLKTLELRGLSQERSDLDFLSQKMSELSVRFGGFEGCAEMRRWGLTAQQ